MDVSFWTFLLQRYQCHTLLFWCVGPIACVLASFYKLPTADLATSADGNTILLFFIPRVNVADKGKTDRAKTTREKSPEPTPHSDDTEHAADKHSRRSQHSDDVEHAADKHSRRSQHSDDVEHGADKHSRRSQHSHDVEHGADKHSRRSQHKSSRKHSKHRHQTSTHDDERSDRSNRHLKQPQDLWLRSHLRVRIVDRNLNKGKHYKEKVVTRI